MSKTTAEIYPTLCNISNQSSLLINSSIVGIELALA